MVGTSSWKQQFAEALSVEPIDDEDEADGGEKPEGEKGRYF
jgi:hypothetical protein